MLLISARIYDRIVPGEFETFLTHRQLAQKTKLQEKKMKRRTKSHLAILRVARGGVIAALYVALTYLAAALGLSSGVIQFRISEALCILPIFLPEAVPALAIGCLVANLLTGSLIGDVIFGALATLIGALGAYLLRRANPVLATLPTVVANMVIVPFVLLFTYGLEGSYFFFMMTVALGEIVCATILGSILAKAVASARIFDNL